VVSQSSGSQNYGSKGGATTYVENSALERLRNI